MKIIQSFSQYDEGNPYLNNDNKYRAYLNFYSFLLSCLTLQKYYESVTMYCNQKAYDTFIKYIPYKEIKIQENKNSFKYWSFNKFDAMKDMNEKFVHVDSDVFIFKDCFSGFTKTNDYDVIIQDILPPESNFVKDFVSNNSKILKDLKIIDSKKYDLKCASCGTVGMSPEIRDKYIELVNKLIDANENNLLVGVDGSPTMIIEELGFYLLILSENLKVFEVLPYNQILEFGVFQTGEIQKYTHMWINTN